ncbi:MAG: hypothetical protein GY864_13990, partial [Desulfobacterales bacterium]|nr:hypothetical protein [Desulfobacterales bacterium]
MFPYVGGIDQAIQFGIYKWKRPDWAKAPEYKKFLTIAREEVDEFGAIWNRDDHNGSIGHPGQPSLSDWADLDAYIGQYSPDAWDKSRYSFFVKLSRLFGRNKYRMAILGTQGPFTITSAIRGFENFMMDHSLYPNELRRLLDHVTKFYVDQAEAWVKFGGKPHGFLIYDDLADQRRPFISPKMFEEFYKPVFKTIFDKVHDLGCDIHLHSCGKIDPLLPYLVDWGVDALELDSPRTVGYPDFT